MQRTLIAALLATLSLTAIAQTTVLGKIPADAVKPMSAAELKQYQALKEERDSMLLWDTSKTPALSGTDKANAAKNKPSDLVIFGTLKTKSNDQMVIDHEYIPQMNVLPATLRVPAKLRNGKDLGMVSEGDRVIAFLERMPQDGYTGPVMRVAGIAKADPNGKPITAPK